MGHFRPSKLVFKCFQIAVKVAKANVAIFVGLIKVLTKASMAHFSNALKTSKNSETPKACTKYGFSSSTFLLVRKNSTFVAQS